MLVLRNVLAILLAAAVPHAGAVTHPDKIQTEVSGIRPATSFNLDSSLLDPMTLAPEPAFNDIVGGGLAQPTIYFLPIINTETENCEAKGKLMLLGTDEGIEICPRSLSFCSEQGTCVLKARGEWQTYNVVRRIEGIDRFVMIDGPCRYGFGVRSLCLDPFYTLAADLKVYHPGDVLYFPELRGMKLPNGLTHDGYMIVRDQGYGIKGEGRFDFFAGTMSWRDSRSPFVKKKLYSEKTRLKFHRVTGELAELIKDRRGYPWIPRQGEGLVAMETDVENTAGTPTSPLPQAMAVNEPPKAPGAEDPAAAEAAVPAGPAALPIQ